MIWEANSMLGEQPYDIATDADGNIIVGEHRVPEPAAATQSRLFDGEAVELASRAEADENSRLS